jgi:uroporphyrinogen-III decarboxylase
LAQPYDRVIDALELREPDRVPTFDLMMEYSIVYRMLGKGPDLLSKLLGSPLVKTYLDRTIPLLRKNPLLAAAVVDSQNDLEMAHYAHDTAAAAVKMGYDSAWVPYYPVFRLQDSQTIDDIFGRRYQMVIDKNGYLALPMYTGGLIRGEEDWRSLDKRTLLRLPKRANKVYRAVQKEYGDRLFVFGFVTTGLFESAWQPMGFERFVVAARKEPGFVRRIISFYTDLMCMIAESLADAGLPGMAYSDDLAFRSGPMLSPRMLDDLFGDGYRCITETAHALGLKIIIHSCGNTTKLLGWLADCGFDGVQSLEPTAGVELAEAKRLVGDRMCLMGNIDVTSILVDAERSEVESSVKRAIADAGAGGGFILSPAHDHEDISIERLHWMVEAAHKYGTYPLSV